MSSCLFSVIIPAHNEEKYIGKCIRSIRTAASHAGGMDRTQIIVVANRCTDSTEAIARELGALTVPNQDRSIAAIRNAGARAARGRIIVTIDADSTMTPGSLREIRALLASGKFVGGGAIPRFDRMSLGIMVSSAYVALNLAPAMIKSGGFLSGAMFWCLKEDFDRIGGFDETLVSLEDMDFARRLKALGDSRGQRYGTLTKSRVITSSRKFDQFGDWYLIKDRALTKAIFTGRDREAADKFYYDVR